MAKYSISKKADLPLEAAILLIVAMTMLLTGTLLFPVSAGVLPYYENGLYGLLLVMFALQVITLGKTPFGDMGKSEHLLALGVVIAAIGIVTCFIPDVLGRLPRVLLFLCFGPGSLALLLQMCFAKDKLRTWVKYRGILLHLVPGCGAVYVLSMLIALLIWKKSLLPKHMIAVVLLIYGAAIVYLAGVLRKVYSTYPEAERTRKGNFELSIDQAMLLLMAIFMLLLGGLLIPVNLGILPFSVSAQLGLLMVIFAVQMLASGSTPIGPFPRSWLIIFFGLLFAALGIVSCTIPGILVLQLTVLVGVLNILGGVITLAKMWISRPKETSEPQGPVPTVIARLVAAQLVMNLLTILFGTSMLVSNLIPGLVIGVILVLNGSVLVYLLTLLVALGKMERDVAGAT